MYSKQVISKDVNILCTKCYKHRVKMYIDFEMISGNEKEANYSRQVHYLCQNQNCKNHWS